MTASDDIAALVDTAIDQGHRGPREIADAILPDLDGDQGEYLFELGLRHFVRDRLRRYRRASSHPTPQGSDAYQNVRDTIADGKWQVRVNHGWKALQDCTAIDLAFAARHHHLLADRNRAAAVQYETLRDQLIEQGVTTVKELDQQHVRSIMNAKAA